MTAVALLLLSLVMETITLFIALKELRGNHPSFRKAFKYGDTTTIAIVFEDGVALLGIIIALLALYITAKTGSTFWDGIGSICVGLLLGIMAIVLVNKNRSYLIEKAMPKEKTDQVVSALKALPLIDDVVSIKSTTLNIDQYKISVEVEIGGATLLHELYGDEGLSAEYERIKSKDDFVRFAADYSDRLSRGIGYHLEKIEKKIKEAVPDVKQIDIEIK
jgi:zinc transporter 9